MTKLPGKSPRNRTELPTYRRLEEFFDQEVEMPQKSPRRSVKHPKKTKSTTSESSRAKPKNKTASKTSVLERLNEDELRDRAKSKAAGATSILERLNDDELSTLSTFSNSDMSRFSGGRTAIV